MTSNSVLHRAHNDSIDLAFVLFFCLSICVWAQTAPCLCIGFGFLCWPCFTIQIGMRDTDGDTLTAVCRLYTSWLMTNKTKGLMLLYPKDLLQMWIWLNLELHKYVLERNALFYPTVHNEEALRRHPGRYWKVCCIASFFKFNLSQQRRILSTMRFWCVCLRWSITTSPIAHTCRRWRWGKSGRRRPSLSDNMFADGEWIVPMQGLPGQGAAYPSVTARPCGFLSGVDRNCRQENSHTDIHQVHRLTVHPYWVNSMF